MEIKRQSSKRLNNGKRQDGSDGDQDGQDHGGEQASSPEQQKSAGLRQIVSQEHAKRADALDRDSIEQELQMIIKRNRSAYEQKYEQPTPEKDA